MISDSWETAEDRYWRNCRFPPLADISCDEYDADNESDDSLDLGRAKEKPQSS